MRTPPHRHPETHQATCPSVRGANSLPSGEGGGSRRGSEGLCRDRPGRARIRRAAAGARARPGASSDGLVVPPRSGPPAGWPRGCAGTSCSGRGCRSSRRRSPSSAGFGVFPATPRLHDLAGLEPALGDVFGDPGLLQAFRRERFDVVTRSEPMAEWRLAGAGGFPPMCTVQGAADAGLQPYFVPVRPAGRSTHRSGMSWSVDLPLLPLTRSCSAARQAPFDRPRGKPGHAVR